MSDTPLRSPASTQRAANVLRRFKRAGRAVLSLTDPSALAGMAILCGLVSVPVATQRHLGLPLASWAPLISPAEALGLTLFILLLGIASSSRSLSGSRLSLYQICILPLPFFNFHIVSRGDPVRAYQAPSELDLRASADGFSFLRWLTRKPYLWRRFESSMLALIVQTIGTLLLFSFLACSLARYPSSSIEYRLSGFLDVYSRLAALTFCWRFQRKEKRGSLSRRELPLWLLTLLPWGLGLVAPILLVARYTFDKLTTAVFSDRQMIRDYLWNSLREELPRPRRSELQSTGKSLAAKSCLRVSGVLLSLQMIALGVFWPIPFATLFDALLAATAIVLLLLAGYGLGNLQPRDKSFRPSNLRLAAAWLLLSLGGAGWGYLIGSSLGLGKLQETCVDLFSVGLLGPAFLGLVIVLGSSLWESKARDWIWASVFLLLGAWGMLAGLAPQFGHSLAPFLVYSSIAAWLLQLPFGLIYQDHFLEPFTLRDLWQRDFPAATRRQLLPAALALVAPLGGLLSPLLAIAAQRGNVRLRLWWSWRSQISPSLPYLP